ncbi:MAG: efflux RND transporter periplasmic adaptor subunit [Bacteriovoracia bacterium]
MAYAKSQEETNNESSHHQIGFYTKIIFSIATCALLGVIGCTKKHSEEELPSFAVIHPWRDRVEISQHYVAQIKGIQHIELRAFEKGYLNEIFVDEGQFVKKGQKMFQIMPVLMNAEYEKAKAEYETSKIEYLNTKKLARQKVVSKNELALATAKFHKYEAELNLAKAHLDLTTIKAPFDGIMGTFRVRLGSLVEEGEALTTVSDISKLWVYFNVSEADYLTYIENKKGNEPISVRLKLANGRMYEQPGVIDTIEADFNNETGNIPFRASFPNPDLLIRHGETGNVVLSKVIDNALVIPQKATFEILDKRYVYTVGQDGTLEAQQITVGDEIPHLFVVHSGLTENDTVLLEGLGKVNKGEKIKPKALQQKELVMRGLELHAE